MGVNLLYLRNGVGGGGGALCDVKYLYSSGRVNLKLGRGSLGTFRS